MNTDAITDSSADEPTKTLCSLTENWWIIALRGVLALIFAALAFWMPQSALLAMTLVFGAFSLVNGAFNLVAAVRHIQKKSTGAGCCSAALSAYLPASSSWLLLGSPRWSWLLFYGLAWGSGRFSPVCWRYPPPFGCVKKSRVKSGLPSVDCSRFSLVLSSCGYFSRPVESFGRRLAVELLCCSLWCHAFVLELASSQNAPG